MAEGSLCKGREGESFKEALRTRHGNPEFVLNEFELFLSCPAKEASILRPRGIQGGRLPLATASLRQHSGKGRAGRRALSFQSGVRSGKHRHRSPGLLGAGRGLIGCPHPPPPASLPRRGSPGRSPGAAPHRQPPGLRAAAPASPSPGDGRGARPGRRGDSVHGRGGSGCESGRCSLAPCGFVKPLTRRGG